MHNYFRMEEKAIYNNTKRKLLYGPIYWDMTSGESTTSTTIVHVHEMKWTCTGRSPFFFFGDQEEKQSLHTLILFFLNFYYSRFLIHTAHIIEGQELGLISLSNKEAVVYGLGF
ncbi:hypothetical protein ACJX0J_009201 [Zea mays]